MKISMFILLAFIFILSLDLKGQNNYQKAYIINNSGDTIHGFINYKNWGIVPNTILFKEKSDGEIKRCNPQSIKGFYVAEEYYTSANVAIDKSLNNVTVEDSVYSENTVNVSAFLRLIVNGEISLLLYRDKYKDHYILQTDTIFTELIYKRYFVKKGKDSVFLYENKKYIAQLMFYMNDNPEVIKDIEVVKYSRQSLSPLFLKYNNKKGVESENHFSYKDLVIRPSVSAGLYHSVYKITPQLSEKIKLMSSLPIPTNSGLMFGVGALAMENRYLQNQSFYFEIFYYRLKYKYDYITSSTKFTKLTYNNYVDVDEHHMVVQMSYRYQPDLKKIKPYIEVSSGFSIIKNGINSHIEEEHFYDQVSTKQYAENTSEQSFGIGLGLYYKNLSYGIRYLSLYGKTIMFNVAYNFKSI
ncbi:MAG: hypothetical protein GXO79_15075 [Chlorobi bacterium]|nr:hypothetical protein [Chlorobiota bacterium]